MKFQLRREVLRCERCGVYEGELHRYGCDAEICPVCDGQFAGCDCNAAHRYPFIHYPVVCVKCGRPKPEVFMVEDEVWGRYIQVDQQGSRLCLECWLFIVHVTEQAKEQFDAFKSMLADGPIEDETAPMSDEELRQWAEERLAEHEQAKPICAICDRHPCMCEDSGWADVPIAVPEGHPICMACFRFPCQCELIMPNQGCSADVCECGKCVWSAGRFRQQTAARGRDGA